MARSTCGNLNLVSAISCSNKNYIGLKHWCSNTMWPQFWGCKSGMQLLLVGMHSVCVCWLATGAKLCIHRRELWSRKVQKPSSTQVTPTQILSPADGQEAFTESYAILCCVSNKAKIMILFVSSDPLSQWRNFLSPDFLSQEMCA